MVGIVNGILLAMMVLSIATAIALPLIVLITIISGRWRNK